MIKHKKNGFLVFLLTLLPGFILYTPAFAKSVAPTKDIRIIIDMSGSMKVNDPLNNRTKAVQLFSEILPENVYAGIWTFAAEVNMLMKHDKVDKQWKKTAFKTAKEIHSYGLFTNIEKALAVTSDDWYDRGKNREKYLILLTDGYVDISKDADKNKQSRKNIIDKILPDLKNKKITVHTIALSDQADHALLKTLSLNTKGRYAVIRNASELDRYFFKLFQSTTKPDTIPLKGNKFRIDKSVQDMTVVLFNKKPDSKLITPGKNVWTHKKHPGSVKWVKSDNYEVITVSSPDGGNWLVDAPVDPDNKIMVVTNLRLQVDKLPASLLPDEPFNIRAYMTEDKKTVKKKEFIELLKVTATLKKKGDNAKKNVDIDYKGDGNFTGNLDTAKLANEHSLIITVTGPTFTREFQHDFSVVIPVAEKTASIIEDKRPVITKKNSTKKMKPIKQMFEIIPSQVKQELIKQKPEKTENKEPAVVKTLPEKKVVRKEDPVKIETPLKEPETIKQLPPPVSAPIPAKPKGTSWVLVGSVVFLLNAFFIVAGFFVYKKLTRANNNLSLEDSPAETETSVSTEKNDKETKETPAKEPVDKQPDIPDSSEVSPESNGAELEELQEVEDIAPEDESASGIPELTDEVVSESHETGIPGLEDIEDVEPEKEISSSEDATGPDNAAESSPEIPGVDLKLDIEDLTDVEDIATGEVELQEKPEAGLDPDIEGLTNEDDVDPDKEK